MVDLSTSGVTLRCLPLDLQRILVNLLQPGCSRLARDVGRLDSVILYGQTDKQAGQTYKQTDRQTNAG